MRIFGVNISLFEPEDLETGLLVEDVDKLHEVQNTNEELYVVLNDDVEWQSNGYFAPPKQRWWMR